MMITKIIVEALAHDGDEGTVETDGPNAREPVNDDRRRGVVAENALHLITAEYQILRLSCSWSSLA